MHMAMDPYVSGEGSTVADKQNTASYVKVSIYRLAQGDGRVLEM